MKVLAFPRTSFNRQILESVKIQELRKVSHLLNSKSEYNRCAVPRLTTKIGDSHYRKWEEDLEKEKMKEMELESKIRTMKKSRNKNRSSNTTQLQPASKRRKISPTEETSDPGHGEKRKLEIPSTNQQAKRQKLVQKDIRDIIRSQGTPSHRPPPMEDAKTYKLLGTCSRPVVPSPPEIPPNLQDEESSTTPNNQSTTTPNTPPSTPYTPHPQPRGPPRRKPAQIPT